MGIVYILRSLVNGRFYIGSTNDLERRFGEHNLGKSKATKFTAPFELVFRQEYDSLNKARRVENKLKKFKSKIILEKIINDSFITLGP
ncbi:GIY-YIG nuclease family protein [Candidatus Daviesbacteria bacterium]|nr:GIY-YIG nuclease family protein [Candidatus Daviesbacteria bacterium]